MIYVELVRFIPACLFIEKTIIYIGDANKRKQGLIEAEKREDDIIRYQ